MFPFQNNTHGISFLGEIFSTEFESVHRKCENEICIEYVEEFRSLTFICLFFLYLIMILCLTCRLPREQNSVTMATLLGSGQTPTSLVRF